MKKALWILIVAGLSWQCSAPPAEEPAARVERPAITGIANFVVTTGSAEEARTFYGTYLGYEEAFQHTRPGVEGDILAFKVNDAQFIELSPTLENEDDDKLIQIGLETSNAQQMRDYLAQEGYEVPATVEQDADGNMSFHIADPEGHDVEFVQYLPDSVQGKTAGQFLDENRVSDHILHVGIHVYDEALTDSLYKGLLGFRPLWRGGMTDEKAEWISLLVPDGSSWVEYMLADRENPPDARRLGNWHHVCLGTDDVQKVYDDVVARGYHGDRKPSIARDGRWLLHMFDQHNTRTEMMVRKPVETPCCSELTDPYTD